MELGHAEQVHWLRFSFTTETHLTKCSDGLLRIEFFFKTGNPLIFHLLLSQAQSLGVLFAHPFVRGLEEASLLLLLLVGLLYPDMAVDFLLSLLHLDKRFPPAFSLNEPRLHFLGKCVQILLVALQLFSLLLRQGRSERLLGRGCFFEKSTLLKLPLHTRLGEVLAFGPDCQELPKKSLLPPVGLYGHKSYIVQQSQLKRRPSRMKNFLHATPECLHLSNENQ